MSPEEQATHIVDQMMAHDAFSQWLAVERLSEKPGYSQLRMTVREEMCNAFRMLHGGVSFSLADSAFGFAANSQGKKAVSIETSISHLHPAYPGDVLTATAEEESLNHRLAIYSVKIHNQEGVLIALFKGTVYRKKEEWT